MRRFFLLFFVGALGACSNPPAPPLPAAFDRPESVSFFCWDRARGQPVALSECAPQADSGDEDDDGAPRAPFELHGVVTQTTTGEVAAVQITGDDDHPPGPIDSDVRVPGFTFAVVGEVPSAVATPSRRPEFTYVISRGSGSLHVIETASFRRGLGASVTEKLRDGGPFFGRGARPVAMELTPNEDALVVAVPVLYDDAGAQLPGEIWIVPIDGADVGDPVRIPLRADLPPPVDLTALADDEQPPVYELRCQVGDPIERAPVPPRTPASDGALPAPSAIAIDAERGWAVVSDTALPILHVIDLDARAELEPINVAVPTRDVALTPPVPATAADTRATERFIYAIQDDDGSVLAVDYSDPARATFGAVLTVSASEPRDRLTLPVPATAVEVATPAYDPASIVLCRDSTSTDPASLHGVFLAVAGLDGRVRIFDVFDLDLPCRGRDCPVPDPIQAQADDEAVAIGRHQPRIASFLEPDDLPRVVEGPTWDVGAIESTVGRDGGGVPGVPVLAAIECPEGLGRVFPDRDAARVCAVTDPWRARSRRFTFAWEGALVSVGATFAPDADAIDVGLDPCARGILGADDVPARGELAGYDGDVVAITGELPPSLSEEERERCEPLVQQTSAGETRPVRLRVLSAVRTGERTGRLFVGAPLDAAGFDVDDVRACFPELLRVEVRVSGAFLASASGDRVRHAVTGAVGDACAIDPARLARGDRARAFPGETFVTPEIAIRFDSAPAVERPVLELVVGNVPPVLAYDIGFDDRNRPVSSLLVELVQNEVDDRLYVVDQATRGLVRLDLTDAKNPLEAFFQ